MVLLFIIVALATTGVLVYLYHIKTPEVVFEPGATFIPLGGWLILVGIGLAASIMLIIGSLTNATYFNMDVWRGLAATEHETITKALIVFEAIVNTVMLCYAMFCLLSLLNKRDILPKYIIGFYLGSAFFIIFDAAAAYYLSNKISQDVAQNMVRAIIAAAIWVPYFKMSTRVRETFIVPYPHGNYSYEEWGAKEDGVTTAVETPGKSFSE